jgi:hypothetical protein
LTWAQAGAAVATNAMPAAAMAIPRRRTNFPQELACRVVHRSFEPAKKFPNAYTRLRRRAVGEGASAERAAP